MKDTLDILEFAGCAASTASMERTPLYYTFKPVFNSEHILCLDFYFKINMNKSIVN